MKEFSDIEKLHKVEPPELTPEEIEKILKAMAEANAYIKEAMKAKRRKVK